MDISIIQQIMTFFNNACDLTADYVDRVEINPIRLYGNIYITGLKRGFTYGSTVDAHIKELRRIQVKTDIAAGDEEGYYFMEPDSEMWIPCIMLSEDLMKIADEGGLMPPKSTWFEPKLRSGLFIHKLE